jgi:hypothetical protein
MRAAFVADDAHHGDLAPCESGGQGRRQRAGCDEAAAPLDRGLLVGRSLSPASPAPWSVSRAADWSRTGRPPTLLEGLSARPCGLVEGLHLVIGEQAVGVVDSHVSDDPVELARACDGDSVGDVVG